MNKITASIFSFTALAYMALVCYIAYPLTTFLKPLPILCLLIAVGVSSIPFKAKSLLIFALCCSLAGDMVLTLPSKKVIEFGIIAFFLTHLCYITLLLNQSQFTRKRITYFLLFLLPLIYGLYGMLPYWQDKTLIVALYCIILIVLFFCASNVGINRLIFISGVVLFLISDATLGLSLFIYPQLKAQIFIMATYYSAQWLLTYGFLRTYQKEARFW